MFAVVVLVRCIPGPDTMLRSVNGKRDSTCLFGRCWQDFCFALLSFIILLFLSHTQQSTPLLPVCSVKMTSNSDKDGLEKLTKDNEALRDCLRDLLGVCGAAVSSE